MDCLKAINERRSVRKFKNIDISNDVIELLLSSAQMAPSAGNMQGRDFIVVSDKMIQQKLAVASHDQTFIQQAPLTIVFIANYRRSENRYGERAELYAVQDATVSAMNLMLAAHSIGLGTCWIGAFDDNMVRDILGIPLNVRPIAIVPVGYPDEQPVMPPRMNLDKIVHWQVW